MPILGVDGMIGIGVRWYRVWQRYSEDAPDSIFSHFSKKISQRSHICSKYDQNGSHYIVYFLSHLNVNFIQIIGLNCIPYLKIVD